jgi:hypothetical protein
MPGCQFIDQPLFPLTMSHHFPLSFPWGGFFRFFLSHRHFRSFVTLELSAVQMPAEIENELIKADKPRRSAAGSWQLLGSQFNCAEILSTDRLLSILAAKNELCWEK